MTEEVNGVKEGPDDEEHIKQKYKLVLKFYKDNEGKTVQLSYNDRLRLVALTQQIVHGPFDDSKLPPLGAFDVIGRDRRNAWISLADLDRCEAMKTFVDEVMRTMPHLKFFLEAHEEVAKEVKNKSEKEHKEQMERDAHTQNDLSLSLLRQRQEEDQRRQIQDALNRQTFAQFKAYAHQQFPSSPDQQALLIRQLQERHYYQYMQQIYQQQMETHAKDTLVQHGAEEVEGQSQEMSKVELAMDNLNVSGRKCEEEDEAGEHNQEEEEEEEEDDHECDEDGDCEYCAANMVDEVAAATMWTKKEIVEFKSSVRDEGGDSIIKVGHGETVTVRVPTHQDGSALYWEFATDSYDIAFGLFFEWQKDEDETEVSVHISDSEDEDLDDEYGEDGVDPESGSRTALVEKGPPTSVIVPIYRRDCHQEVYGGSHQYPGPGVYLLKFDNTYSLWRSKTLYYRVFYTK